MPADRWIWKEWSRQCHFATEAIKRGDLDAAEAHVREMELLDQSADPEQEALPFEPGY